MRFLLDENIPGLAEKNLRSLGHETYRPIGRTPDKSIFSDAEKCGAIILTRDRDFLNFIPSQTSGIVYIRIHPSIAEEITICVQKLLMQIPNMEWLYGKVIILEKMGYGTWMPSR